LPDLNPIEMAFARVKARLRKAAERTVPALWDRIDAFTHKNAPTISNTQDRPELITKML
jgi:hypothetical protein